MRPPAAGKPGELPIILFSHGLYGHCDLHATLGCQLAQQGFVVVVVEHEGGAASYCRTEKGEVKAYLHPPKMNAEQIVRKIHDLEQRQHTETLTLKVRAGEALLFLPLSERLICSCYMEGCMRDYKGTFLCRKRRRSCCR